MLAPTRRATVLLVGALALTTPVALAPAAHAQPVHQVAAGESLWSVAAANGISATALAAANGLPADTAVQAGQVLRIPSGTAGGTGAAAGAASGGGPSTSTSGSGTGGSAGSQAGSYVVQPGDSLTAIAARAGVTPARLAAYNGRSVATLLGAGTRLALPRAGSSTPGTSDGAGPASGSSTAVSASGSAAGGSSSAGATTAGAAGTAASAAGPSGATTAGAATPRGTRLDGASIAQIASANGVASDLAQAIAWQESGFDNGAVSSVGARGVMQVMPGTWSWIAGNLASHPLDPTSASDNVKAGSLYLRHLLRETGGDADLAAAGYYQGLASVRARGMYDDTKRYVENVRALRARFGG
jgi:LysM repeat protein